MLDKERETLDALKFELGFLELGGYSRSVREPRKEIAIFRESPSCPNNGSEERAVPCAECFLMRFVAPGKEGESIPCHHIPLNERGDTVDSISASGEDFEVQEAMRKWLRKKIAELEAADNGTPIPEPPHA
jgi:hypothetical protein